MTNLLPVPIIRSKLYPPRIAPDTVARERLMALAPAFASSAVTLISAPAGFGKSTLASQWLTAHAGKCVWFSLESADNDLRRFLSYLVAGMDNLFPECCGDTCEALQAVHLQAADELAGIFGNDFEALGESAVIVLDDYYRISSPEIHSFVDALLKRPPSGLHLIVITRRDPPLSMQILRASGVLTEIRMRHLTFSQDETMEFVRSKLGDLIADRDIARLHERTEGWPVGLRLATLAARESTGAKEFVQGIPNNLQFVRGYLMQEVLANCPDKMRAHLLRTAFLDRFCAPLCDAVSAAGPDSPCALPSGEEFIQWLNDAGMFTIALDSEQVWFRYHHMFQSLLREHAAPRFGRDTISRIYICAAHWSEKHDLFEEAIQQFLAADATAEAVELIIRQRNTIMNREEWHRLADWLQRLPAGMVESRPELQLLMARLHRTRGAREEFAAALDAAQLLLETVEVSAELRHELFGSLESGRCFQLFAESDGAGAVVAARRALELLAADSLAERGFAMIILAGSLLLNGRVQEAREALYSSLPDESAIENNPTYITRILIGLCFVNWMDADLAGLESAANEASKLARATSLLEALTIAVSFLAAIDYERNHLTVVVERMQRIGRSDVVISAEFHAQGIIIAALAHQELGNEDIATRLCGVLNELALNSRNVYLIGLAQAFEAELALRQGELAKAMAWAEQFDTSLLTPMYASFSPLITCAKILVASDSAASRVQATRVLDDTVDYLTRTHNKRYLAEVLALRAILRHANGQSDVARDDLAEAIRLAQPSRFIRLFVDLGPRLGRLLNRLELDEEGLAYVGEILAAFRQPVNNLPGKSLSATVDAKKTGVEPLSRRELQVIGLLADRLSNAEIANRLHISAVTVKRHTANIYEKLGVHGRRHAVAKALGLGLLSKSGMR